MILRIPSYYKDFACIADRCRDSCCVGWEIDIDQETFDYYKSIPGPFGHRLRASMTAGEENSFRLKKGRRCPFLNESNLCDIVLTLGETSLCEICTEYPRFTLEYGNVREKCLGISCEEVGRILFSGEEKVTFEESEPGSCRQEEYSEGQYFEEEEGSEQEYSEEEYGEEEEYSEEDEYSKAEYLTETDEAEARLGAVLSAARDTLIALVQDRSRPIEERICRYLSFAGEVQDYLNREDPEGILCLARSADPLTGDAPAGGEVPSAGSTATGGDALFSDRDAMGEAASFAGGEAFALRKRVLDGMEILDEEWRGAIARVEEVYRGQSEEESRRMMRDFMDFLRPREYEYEHLMVYFTFRYGMKSVFDFRFLAKAQLAVLSFLTIRDMDAVRFADQGRSFSREDRVDTARIYSKEVEHSEDNLEYLAEAFLFEEILQPEALQRQVLWGLK